MALTGKQLQDILSKVAEKGATKLPSVTLPEQKSVIPGVQQETANLSTRLASVGVNSNQVTDTRNPIEKVLNLTENQNFLFDIFELINRPQQALFGAIDAAQTGKDIGAEALKGLTGQEKTSGGELISNITGMQRKSGLEGITDWQNWAGFALDVFLDPADLGLALVTGGTSLAATAVGNAKDIAKGIDTGLDIEKIAKGALEGTGDLTKVAITKANDVRGVVNKFGTVQDVLLGKGKRLYKPKNAEEYIKLLMSTKARDVAGVEAASLTSMTFKSIGAGFRTGTALTDSIVEATFAKLDSSGNSLKQYQVLKDSIKKAAVDRSSQVKRAAGRAVERMNTSYRRFMNIHDTFLDFLETNAKKAGVSTGEYAKMVMDGYEYKYLSRVSSPRDLIDFLTSSNYKYLPFREETISDLKNIMGPEMFAKIEPTMTTKTIAGVDVIEFDPNFFSYNNKDMLNEIKASLPSTPIRRFNAEKANIYRKTLEIKDPVKFSEYEDALKKYNSELDKRVLEKYKKGYTPIEDRRGLELVAKDTEESGFALPKSVKKDKFNAIKRDLIEKDIVNGKHPQALLESGVDIENRYSYWLTNNEREFSKLQLSEADLNTYETNVKKLKDEIRADAKIEYPSAKNLGPEYKAKQDAARKAYIAKRTDKMLAEQDKFLREKTISFAEHNVVKMDAPDMSLGNVENIKKYFENTYPGSSVEATTTGFKVKLPRGRLDISFENAKTAEKVFNPATGMLEAVKAEKVFNPATGAIKAAEDATVSFDPGTGMLKRSGLNAKIKVSSVSKDGKMVEKTVMVASDTVSNPNKFLDLIELQSKENNLQMVTGLRNMSADLRTRLTEQVENTIKGFDPAEGNIRLGNYYSTEDIARLEGLVDPNNSIVKSGIDKFAETIRETQRTIGINEFGDPDAVINTSMAGYATHTYSQELTQVFERIKKEHQELKNLDFAYFAPGRVRQLSERQYLGSALEANNFRTAFYKDALQNDEWMKANLKDVGEDAKKAMEEYFNVDLFSREAGASLTAMMSDSYSAINKNHKTSDILIAMSIGKADTPTSAFRVVNSETPVQYGFKDLTRTEVYELRKTLLKNKEYEGTGYYVEELLKSIDKSLQDGKKAIIEKHIYEMVLKTSATTPKDALKLIDTFNSTFKVGKTLSPAFNIKNIFGNLSNQWLAGVPISDMFRNWNRAVAMTREMKVIDDLVAKGGLDTLTDAQKATYATYQEFLDAGFMTRDSVYKLLDVDGSGSKVWADPKNIFGQSDRTARSLVDNPITDLNMRMNLTVDGWARLSLYLYAKDNPGFVSKLGIDPTAYDAAMKSVRLVHFDPNDLTFFEDDIMKRLIPFYTFTRQNLAFQLTNISRHSVRYNRVFKAMDAWNKEMMNLSPEDLQKYQREQFYIPVFADKDGKYTAIKTSIPATALSELSLSPTEMLRDVLSKASPLLKAPIEKATNTVIFTGQPIERYKNEPSSKLPYMTKSTEWLLSQTGLDVPASGIASLIGAIGKTGGLASGQSTFGDVLGAAVKATNVTGEISPQDTRLSKMYEDLNALQDKVKELTARGVKVPTITEITAKATNAQNDQRLQDLQRIQDMINNIKR